MSCNHEAGEMTAYATWMWFVLLHLRWKKESCDNRPQAAV